MKGGSDWQGLLCKKESPSGSTFCGVKTTRGCSQRGRNFRSPQTTSSTLAFTFKVMDTRTLYNQWSATYDDTENKTRDLEKRAGQTVLSAVSAKTILEVGCGTGKNTDWLQHRAEKLTAVDLSENMLQKAKEKVSSRQVQFVQADVTRPWEFASEPVDLVTCSLILEHIENLSFIFQQAALATKPGGHFYVCELHPYKQYSGSKARFETAEGLKVLDCYLHHVSDYFKAATKAGFVCEAIDEWFDEDNNQTPPRLLSFLFRLGNNEF